MQFIAGDVVPEIPEGDSGRLQLAMWLASKEHPLTSRVWVNRVWQHHFGEGLVANPSNFGVQSPPPSHPAMLDWLARDFVDHGWSNKHLHRRIVLSSAYRRVSNASVESHEKDAANLLYSHQNRRRMDADQFRDSLLLVSHDLQPGDGGRHPFAPTEKLKYSQGNPFRESFDHQHRSVYLMSARLNRHPMMALFDGPDTNVSTGKRNESTVALQSLFLMNGEFLSDRAESFAKQILAVSNDDDEPLTFAWKSLFAVEPSAQDRNDVREFLSRVETSQDAWTSLARVLLSSNPFIYID